MYMLIPAGLDIGVFQLIAVFIAATLLGFASHTPAGLGVFDATILIGLGSEDREQLLAALLMFRFLYHLVPLTIALALFGGVEALRYLRGRAGEGAASDRRIEFQPDHTGDDQGQAEQSQGIGRLAIEEHADEDAADRADTGPHRVSRAKRQ
jgi:glycosyltransferase 2 family protein